MKEKFIELLKTTGCPQADLIVNNLEKLGFFRAPASTKFHLTKEGGLVEHSVSVCETALLLRKALIGKKPELEEKLPEKSVILASLLHDVCKAEIYKVGSRNVKNEQTGVWEKVPVYEADYSYFPVGHGEKSVIRLLRWGVELSTDEMLAIRWHMGVWDLATQSREETGNLSAAKAKSPLVTLLSCADELSTSVIEE